MENNKEIKTENLDLQNIDQKENNSQAVDLNSLSANMNNINNMNFLHESANQTENEKRIALFRIGVMIFLTFVCCILFFFAILRFEGFATGWSKVLSAAQPIIIGLVIAYLINPIMKFFEPIFLKVFKKKPEEKRIKMARGCSVASAIIIFVVIIALLIAAIVPTTIQSVADLTKTLPGQVQTFIQKMEKWNFGNEKLAEYVGTILIQVTDHVEKWATNDLLPKVQTYATEITSGVISAIRLLFNFVIGIIVALYVLAIQETLEGQSKMIIYAVFKPKVGNAIIHTVRKSSEIFGGFITGKLLDSLIIGIICYIGCLILRMPSSLLVAVIIGVTNIIPFFGPFIGAVPTILLVVILDPIKALWLLIFILILQQVDGNIIGPKIIGNKTGLSSFWVMFAILVFGSLWGFFGMLLGVPVMAVIYYIVGKLVRIALRKKDLPVRTSDYIDAHGVDTETNTIQYSRDEDEDTEKK